MFGYKGKSLSHDSRYMSPAMMGVTRLRRGAYQSESGRNSGWGTGERNIGTVELQVTSYQ